jgi:hypothetical protein
VLKNKSAINKRESVSGSVRCHDLAMVRLRNRRAVFGLDTGFIGHSPLQILDYKSQWRSRQFTITVYSLAPFLTHTH